MTQAGVMMIHGTFGSPKEFYPLEKYLQAKGFKTLAVALPGHGDSPRKALVDVTAEDIIEECRASLADFSETCDDVYLVGQSLGGLCSLVLASEQPEKLVGVVSLAAPYEHAYYVNYAHGFLTFPFTRLPVGLAYLPEIYMGLDHPMFLPWWFPKLYDEATKLFILLQDSLPTVNVPLLLGHSPYDLIVPFEEMDKIAEAIDKPALITKHEFEHCGHQIFPKSREVDAAVELIHDYIQQLQTFREKDLEDNMRIA